METCYKHDDKPNPNNPNNPNNFSYEKVKVSYDVVRPVVSLGKFLVAHPKSLITGNWQTPFRSWSSYGTGRTGRHFSYKTHLPTYRKSATTPHRPSVIAMITTHHNPPPFVLSARFVLREVQAAPLPNETKNPKLNSYPNAASAATLGSPKMRSPYEVAPLSALQSAQNRPPKGLHQLQHETRNSKLISYANAAIETTFSYEQMVSSYDGGRIPSCQWPQTRPGTAHSQLRRETTNPNLNGYKHETSKTATKKKNAGNGSPGPQDECGRDRDLGVWGKAQGQPRRAYARMIERIHRSRDQSMSEHILVAVAWPYANGSLHLGHLAGCYLPADIFARYHRAKGDRVLMVSGSDQHGTPVTIRAEQEGLTPQEVVAKYHRDFLDSWQRMGISFDLFTTTGTDNHRQVSQDFFLKLLDKGYIYKATMLLPYCADCRRFLPDRYVEGGCPNCGNTRARGDQCDDCGHTLDPQDLINPRCSLSGTTPSFENSDHFFLKLSAFRERLLDWLQDKEYWRPNVLNFTKRYLEEALLDRAITRDISWGVPVPLDGYEDKRIYVWFEAVIGYLSASVQWATDRGEPDAWKEWWHNPDAKPFYFIGKDNIPFHTMIWPAMLMGYEGFNLPYDVPANEFLSLEGRQFSTSQRWALWLPDYLERYDPDPLRFYLTMSMPETGDTDFSWGEFIRRNNSELVGTFGNLVQRVLTLTYRNFDGRIPTPGELDAESRSLLQKCSVAVEDVGASLSACRFRLGLTQAMALAQEANRYLDSKAPWATIKTDREETATTLWVAMATINCLKVVMAPFIPFSAQRLHNMLGYEGQVTECGWHWLGTIEQLPPGQAMERPQALFTKLEDGVAEEETSRLVSARG